MPHMFYDSSPNPIGTFSVEGCVDKIHNVYDVTIFTQLNTGLIRETPTDNHDKITMGFLELPSKRNTSHIQYRTAIPVTKMRRWREKLPIYIERWLQCRLNHDSHITKPAP